jgi:hypothetical protein
VPSAERWRCSFSVFLEESVSITADLVLLLVVGPANQALASEMAAAGLMEVYGGHHGGNRGVGIGIGAGSIILKEAIRRSQYGEHTVVNRL